MGKAEAWLRGRLRSRLEPGPLRIFVTCVCGVEDCKCVQIISDCPQPGPGMDWCPAFMKAQGSLFRWKSDLAWLTSSFPPSLLFHSCLYSRLLCPEPSTRGSRLPTLFPAVAERGCIIPAGSLGGLLSVSVVRGGRLDGSTLRREGGAGIAREDAELQGRFGVCVGSSSAKDLCP